MFSLSKKFILLLTIGLWGCFLFLTKSLSFDPANGLGLFDVRYDSSVIHYIIEFAAYSVTNIITFILPGLIWICALAKSHKSFPLLIFYSFLASVLVLIAATTVFKIFTGVELNSVYFLSILAIFTIVGIMRLMARKQEFIHNYPISEMHVTIAALMILTLAMCGWMFQDKVIWVDYDRNYSEEYILSIPLGQQTDLQENFGSVDSLKRHILPFWDLEYLDRFGYAIIDPPLHMFTSLFINFLTGESFAAQSLNSLFVMLISFWAAWMIAGEGLDTRQSKYIGLLIPLLFLNYLYVFISHPEYAMILTDLVHFLMFFTIAQLYFLMKGQDKLFLIFALLGFLTKYEAGLFTILGLLFYAVVTKPETGRVVRLTLNYLLLILPYVALMACIGFARGDLGGYTEAFFVERFMRLDYMNILPQIFSDEATSPWEGFSMSMTTEFIRQLLMGSLCLAILILWPHKDRTCRFYSLIAIAYFVLILFSRTKRIHYISPLAIFSAIIAFRMLMQFYQKEGGLLNKIGFKQGKAREF